MRVKPKTYAGNQEDAGFYYEAHAFPAHIFLSPQRPKSHFVVDKDEVLSFAGETFRLMSGQGLPEELTISILSFDEFKMLHSLFGRWGDGILGFSLHDEKKIFVRQNNLDEMLIVLGHEMGHVLTDALPNRHDEEAKAFAFSIEWANTIKKHNIANLGSSIKDEFDFQPARNGLHDVAFGFVNLMARKGLDSRQLHERLVKKYLSVFDRVY